MLHGIARMNANICSVRIDDELRETCLKDYDMCVAKALEIKPNEEMPEIRRDNPMSQGAKNFCNVILVSIGVIFGFIIFIKILCEILGL